MRSFRLFVSLLIIIILFSCRNDSDVLAEMNSRKITRFEFHQWLQNHDTDSAHIYKNSVEAEKKIKQMAVEILTVEKALSEKFETTPFYANIKNAVYANLLSSYYKNEIKKQHDYTEAAVEIKIIKLNVPGEINSTFDMDIYNDKISLSSYLIQQYKSGADFDELRLKYSEETGNSYTDNTEVIPLSLLDKRIYEKIKNLKNEECVMEPVVLMNSIVVVKLIRWLNLTKADAEKLIKDRKLYDRFLDYVSEGVIEYIIAENSSELGIFSNIKNAQFKKRSELLFSIKGRHFSAGDFDDLLDLFQFLKSEKRESVFSLQAKRDIALAILNEHILSYAAEKKGLSDRPDFLNKWKYVEKGTLAGAYKYCIISGINKTNALSVSKKNTVHSKAENSSIETIETIDNDKKIINQKKLENTRIEKIKNMWENEILNSSNFILHREVMF